MSDIAQEWMEKIGRYDLATIKKALDHFQEHEEHPPSLPKFMALCEANKPHEYTQALPHKLTAEDIERNKKRLHEAAEVLHSRKDFKAWAKRIVANPRNYPDISLKFAREALAMPDVEIAT